MSALSDSIDLDLFILNQRKEIRFYVFFAIGQVILGIIIIIFAFVSPSWLSPESPIISDTFKGLFGIGGAFVSSLCTLQIKEIPKSRKRIHGLSTVNELKEALKNQPEAERDDLQEELDKFLWDILRDAALS
jgi:hypothetical protein